MKQKAFTITLIMMAAIMLSPSSEKHFLQDKQYREEVHEAFTKRKALAKGREKELFSVFNEKVSLEEKEALEFLYAYMPLSDLADYNGDYFLEQVRYAFKARDYFTWGKTIPEDVFRHFVLVYRVNNENLDTARMVIFNEIKDRVKNMSMYDAALEVNHWCHEKVTYRPSDARTSSSLASMRTGFGRCGEESTFAVTALRAVGIPARQCYTPRWAHTDDNHAWVEVWVDGKWYFMGACEPDPALNMGWFATPATRAMMVHSNAFGKYTGHEEINHRTDLFARINMLPNYTETKKITITVIDKNNIPVKDASVKFKLYNYAEYYPISAGKTDENGKISLTTGLGDLLIWAFKDNMYEYQKLDVRKQDGMTLKLDKAPGKEYTGLLEIDPPKALPGKLEVSKAKVDANTKRLQYEDSLRNAYIATFMKETEAKQLALKLGTDSAKTWFFIKKSEGNYAEIANFIKRNAGKAYLFDFLGTLSDKDLRDTPCLILESHFNNVGLTKKDDEIFIKGILSPRISNELIRPWRIYLHQALTGILGGTPSLSALEKFTKDNITVDNTSNYYNCPLSPRGVFELRVADAHSRDIFFVAACRSISIPAYLDAATNQIFAYENEKWQPVSFEISEKKHETGKVVLNYRQKSEIMPQYWTHYTIARYENGDFTTLDFEDDPRVASFPATLELEAGYYLLSTGNRYSDGTTLSKIDFFTIDKGKTVEKDIILRELTPRKENYGVIHTNKKIETISSESLNIADMIKEKELILCFIDPTREPTRHLFNDIRQLKNSFEKWGGNILFVIPSDKATSAFNAAQLNLPVQSRFMIDKNESWMNEIVAQTNQEFRDNYPLIFIINQKGEIVFKSEGYRIGTGELLYKSLTIK